MLTVSELKGRIINTVGQTRGLSYTSGVNVGGVTMNGATAQLYVIGPVNPTDANNKVQISNLQVGFWVKDSNTPGGVRWGTLTINITTGVLNVLSCKTPNVTVPLGKHCASDFATVGTTSAPVAFNIVVNECSQNMAAVSYTLKPAASRPWRSSTNMPRRAMTRPKVTVLIFCSMRATSAPEPSAQAAPTRQRSLRCRMSKT